MVTYQQTADDLWHLAWYLCYKTAGGCIWAGFMLPLPLLMNLLELYFAPIHSARHHLLANHFWFVTSIMYVVVPLALVGCSYLAASMPYKYRVTISEDLWVMQSSMPYKSSWRDFARLADEGDYLYFIGRRRVAQIPKRAFNSRAEADAFFQTALTYWREAKGLPAPPVPDTAGVWPPAPRLSNSAEPGDGREG